MYNFKPSQLQVSLMLCFLLMASTTICIKNRFIQFCTHTKSVHKPKWYSIFHLFSLHQNYWSMVNSEQCMCLHIFRKQDFRFEFSYDKYGTSSTFPMWTLKCWLFCSSFTQNTTSNLVWLMFSVCQYILVTSSHIKYTYIRQSTCVSCILYAMNQIK